jgi:hypothetical protein
MLETIRVDAEIGSVAAGRSRADHRAVAQHREYPRTPRQVGPRQLWRWIVEWIIAGLADFRGLLVRYDFRLTIYAAFFSKAAGILTDGFEMVSSHVVLSPKVRIHSYLSAIIGSSLAARWAGT